LLERGNWRWVIVALIAALAVYVGTGGPGAVFGSDQDPAPGVPNASGDIAVSVGTKWANTDEFCDGKNQQPDTLEGETVEVGQVYWYCIEIEVNQGSDGDGVIQDLVIEDYLPSEVTPTGEAIANVVPESICEADPVPGGLLVCDIGTVNAGQTIVIAVEVTVNGTDDDGDGLIENIATFRDDAEVSEGINTTDQSVVLLQYVDLVLDKEVSDDTALPGDTLHFTLYVNVDESQITPPGEITFRVYDNLPFGLTLVEDSLEVFGANDYDCSGSSATYVECWVTTSGDVWVEFDVLVEDYATPGEICNYFYVDDQVINVNQNDNFDCFIILGEGLRHLDPFGNPISDIDDQNNLVGYTHEICLFGIDANAFNDENPVPTSAWVIVPLPDSGADVDGDGPDAADPGPPSVNSAVTFQDDVDFDGIDEECIRYTSFTPGEQTVVLVINGEDIEIDPNYLPEDIVEFCEEIDASRGEDFEECELVFDFYGWVDPNDPGRIQQPLIKEWNLLEPTIIGQCFFFDGKGGAARGVDGGYYLPVWCPDLQTALDEEGNEYIVGPENLDGETIHLPAIQDPVSGTWFSLPVALGEYVVGSHFTATLDEIVTLVDGAVVEFTVSGTCGFLAVQQPGGGIDVLWFDDGGSIVIDETVGEPIPFVVFLIGCQNANGFLTVHIQASYPAQIGSFYENPAPEEITVRLAPPPPVEKVPLAPWAGTRQPVQHNWLLNDQDDEDFWINPYTGICIDDIYGFDFIDDLPPEAARGELPHFPSEFLIGVRYTIQSGNAGFIGNEAFVIPGFPNTTDQVIVGIDEHCNSTAVVEAEDEGEVDVEMELVLLDLKDYTIVGASGSKVAQPLFYLKFEDLTLGAPVGARLGHNYGYWSPSNPYIAAPQDADITTDVSDVDVNVSADALIRGRVRGWFTNSNPSGRPQETKTDALGFSYDVPENRWVLPDDWEALAGGPTAEIFRPGWDTNVDPGNGVVVCELYSFDDGSSPVSSIIDLPADIDACGVPGFYDVESEPVAGPFSPLHTKDPYVDYAPFVNPNYFAPWRVPLIDGDTAYGGYIPDGDVDWWDAPMQPAQLTWWLLNESTDAGGFVPTDKTDIYRTSPDIFGYLTNPFYATHIPFSEHVVAQAQGGGFLWDTFNDFPDNDGWVDEYDLYYFWEPALINVYPTSGASPIHTVNEFGATVIRTHTVYTDNHGEAMTYINGDHIQSLLTFEDCEPSLAAGPLCEQGDVVGHSTVIATVDYPDFRKHPQIQSTNVVTIDWIWGGFKIFTVENEDPAGNPLPTFRRAIVLHLLDRDGYCDNSPSLHPVLGETVDWVIDSGEGVFIDGEENFTVGLLGLSATTTVFDASTHDPDRTYPTLDPNECQTWVIVQNSLQTETNVFFIAHDPEGDVGFDVILFGDAGIEVTKTADVDEAHVGDTITYTVEATNVGTGNLTDLVFVDSLVGELTCDTGDGILVPEESVECEYTYTVLDTDADPLENTVTVTGTGDVDGVPTDVSDEDSASVDILNPAISVQKSGPDVALVTTEATYTFIITNTGDATLNDVSASDDVLGALDDCSIADLGPGEQVTCTATTELSDEGEITNTVTVSGTDNLGEEVSATDSHTTEVLPITLDLFEGWNEIDPWMGVGVDGISNIISTLSTAVSPDVWEAIAHFDNPTQTWTQTFVDAPLEDFNTLGSIEPGSIYWIFVTSDATLTFPLP
jgi:uncharacterized repeat protein (TIGR01451 family)